MGQMLEANGYALCPTRQEIAEANALAAERRWNVKYDQLNRELETYRHELDTHQRNLERCMHLIVPKFDSLFVQEKEDDDAHVMAQR